CAPGSASWCAEPHRAGCGAPPRHHLLVRPLRLPASRMPATGAAMSCVRC
ncbi:MAG: hypothetical protein AVDCRST_MAG07-3529, partial [uncultured Frankineae bacterium]